MGNAKENPVVDLLRQVYMVIRRPYVGPHGSAFGAITGPRERLAAREELLLRLSGFRKPEEVEKAMEDLGRVWESSPGGPEDSAVRHDEYLYGGRE